MRRKLSVILMALMVTVAGAQQRKVQNKPYIDLRPLHFGIQVGLNLTLLIKTLSIWPL